MGPKEKNKQKKTFGHNKYKNKTKQYFSAQLEMNKNQFTTNWKF